MQQSDNNNLSEGGGGGGLEVRVTGFTTLGDGKVAFVVESHLSGDPPQATFVVRRRYSAFERLNAFLRKDGLPALKLPRKLLIHSADALEARKNALEEELNRYIARNGYRRLGQFLGLPSVTAATSPQPSSSRSAPESYTPRTSLDLLDDTGVGEVDNDDEEEEASNNNGGLARSPENDEEANEDAATSDEYALWTLEMLAARASLRAERRESLRIAKICIVAGLTSLLGSMFVKANRWGLLGAALSSAVTAAFAALGAEWRARHHAKRRVGFGLRDNPLLVSDGTDAKKAFALISERQTRKALKERAPLNHTGTVAERNGSLDAATPIAHEHTLRLITAADVLAQDGKHHETLALFAQEAGKFDITGDGRLLWRHARAVYYTCDSTSHPVRTLEDTLAVLRAFTAARTDGSLSPTGSAPAEDLAFVFKWMALVSNAWGERKGTIRDRVESALDFQRHTMTALRLNPQDGTLWFMLGRFCFDVAGLGWLERKAARAISGFDPPKTTYEEALGHFEKSMGIRPGPAAAYEMGRCYLQLKDKENARRQFTVAMNWVKGDTGDALVPEELAAIRDAKQQLTEMGE